MYVLFKRYILPILKLICENNVTKLCKSLSKLIGKYCFIWMFFRVNEVFKDIIHSFCMSVPGLKDLSRIYLFPYLVFYAIIELSAWVNFCILNNFMIK